MKIEEHIKNIIDGIVMHSEETFSVNTIKMSAEIRGNKEIYLYDVKTCTHGDISYVSNRVQITITNIATGRQMDVPVFVEISKEDARAIVQKISRHLEEKEKNIRNEIISKLEDL